VNDSLLKSDNFLKNFTGKLTNGHADDTVEEQPEDFGAFGWLRGSRERAVMLEVRRKNGNVSAFPYAWLERADFDPSEGITLKFANQILRLVGRNLNTEVRSNLRLYDGLVRHRIPWLREADEPAAMAAPKHATVIEQVDFL
jgi:hypothetical protein